MGRSHDITISGFDLDRIEAEARHWKEECEKVTTAHRWLMLECDKWRFAAESAQSIINTHLGIDTTHMDYTISMELEIRFGFTPAEAVVVNMAIAQIKTGNGCPVYTTYAEALQKESMRIGVKIPQVSFSRISDLSLCKKVADLFLSNASDHQQPKETR